MDTNTFYMMFGAVIFAIITFLIGCMTNIYTKAKVLRMFKMYKYPFILRFWNKDNKTVFSTIINAASPQPQVIQWKEYKWIVDKERVYREDAQEKQFFINRENMIWDEGLPCITVDFETLTPVFYGQDLTTRTKPLQLGAFTKAWIDNEKAKIFAQRNMFEMLLMICLLLGLVGAGIGYMNHNDIVATKTMVGEIEMYYGINATTANTSALIRAMGGNPAINNPVN